jgi:hypothetical protein
MRAAPRLVVCPNLAFESGTHSCKELEPQMHADEIVRNWGAVPGVRAWCGPSDPHESRKTLIQGSNNWTMRDGLSSEIDFLAIPTMSYPAALRLTHRPRTTVMPTFVGMTPSGICIANLRNPANHKDSCQAANFASPCPPNCQRPSRGLVHRCPSVCIGGSNALLGAPPAIQSEALEPPMHTDAHRCTPMHTDAHRWTKPRAALSVCQPFRSLESNALTDWD